MDVYVFDLYMSGPADSFMVVTLQRYCTAAVRMENASEQPVLLDGYKP